MVYTLSKCQEFKGSTIQNGILGQSKKTLTFLVDSNKTCSAVINLNSALNKDGLSTSVLKRL